MRSEKQYTTTQLQNLRWLAVLAVLAVLLMAFGLRMWHLNTESVWHDEGWSIRAMRGPFTTPDDNTPYVYYLTGHLLWRLGAGDSALAFRYVSVLLGTLTAAVVLNLGRRWFGLSVGLAAGILSAISPLLWEYAQEVRAYVAVPLLALLLLGLSERILDQRGRVPPRLWGMVVITEVIGLYTHNLAVPLIVWLNAALGIVWFLERDWRRIFTWAGLQTGVILAYVPWLLTQSPSGTPLNSPPQINFDLVREIWAAYFLPVLLQLQEHTPSVWVDGLGLLFMGALLLMVWQMLRGDGRSRRSAWLLFSHALIIPAASFALIRVAHIDFHPRYFITAVPGTLLMVVAALAVLRTHRREMAVAVIGVTTAFVAVSAGSLHQITTTRAYQHDDFRALAQYYAELPANAAIVLPFNDEPALMAYYAPLLDIQAEFVTVPLYASEEKMLAALQDLTAEGPRHVEFLTWYQLPADVRGMYPCVLTAASEKILPTATFYGLHTEGYMLGSGDFAPLSLEAAPQMTEISLEDAAYWVSPQGVCMRTVWTLPQATAENLRVAVEVLNPLGAIIARTDAEIARDDNTPTAQWTAGESGAAYALLHLPQGAPLDDYRVQWTVYSAVRPSGLDVLDAAGQPAGKVYTAPGTIRVQGLPYTGEISQVVAISAESIETGKPFDVTVLIGAGVEDPTVTLSGDGWQLEQASEPGALTWLRFDVPPGSSGDAVLSVGGEEIAVYPVVDVPRIFTAPDVDYPVDVHFPGVGALVGVSDIGESISLEAAPEVTLIWQAEEQAKPTAYTVFVQLIGMDGQVIAQSDLQPAYGDRPTTGWVDGEFIVDHHVLSVNDATYRGPVTLIAGFYDAADGFRRVRTESGQDHATLQIDLIISGGT